MTPVEMIVLELVQIHPFEASHVDVKPLRIGTRNIEWCDAAIRAEKMPGRFRVEGIGRDIVRLSQQPERAAWNDPMDVSLLRANRAVAFRDALEIAADFEADASAMASAAIGSFDRFLFDSFLFVRLLHERS